MRTSCNCGGSEAWDGEINNSETYEGDLRIRYDQEEDRVIGPEKGRKVVKGDLIITGEGSGTLNLRNMDIAGNLIVDLPNATVENGIKVGKKVRIKDVSANSWVELVSGNSLVFESVNDSLIIPRGVEPKEIYLKVDLTLITSKNLLVRADKGIKITVKKDLNAEKVKEIFIEEDKCHEINLEEDTETGGEKEPNKPDTGSDNPSKPAETEEDKAKKEAERQAKLVEETLEEIRSAESLEVLEAIKVDKSLSEENQAKLTDAKKAKKAELEKIEADKEAEQKEVEDTLEKIKAAKTLKALESIEIDKNLSEDNKAILVDAKAKKKLDLEENKAIEDGIKEDYDKDKETIDDQEDTVVDYYIAQNIVDKIAELKEVSLDSKGAVELARTSYEALTDKQKTFVTNLEVLKAAEAKIKELEKEKAEQAEEERQDEIVAEIKKAIDAAESLKSLEAIKIDESLSGENKAILEKAIADKKVELELAKLEEDKKAAQAVEGKITALGEISLNSKEAVESARSVYDELTEEQKELVTNLGTLIEAEAEIEKLEQAKAKEEAEQAEKERQAKIVADTLADIKSAKDLEALGKITIDESLSEENKIELENIKSDKSIEIKENNYKIAIEEIKTQVDSTIKTLNGQRKLNVEKFEKDKISFKVTFILEKKVGQRFYKGPDVKATRDSGLISIATSSGMLHVKLNQFKEIEKYIDTIEYNGEKVNGLSSAINKAPNKVGEVIDMNHNVKLKLKDEYGDNKILEFDIIAELAE